MLNVKRVYASDHTFGRSNSRSLTCALSVVVVMTAQFVLTRTALAQPAVRVITSTEELYEGDTLTYQVVAQGVGDNAESKIPGVGDLFEVQGPRRSSSSSVQIFNGRRTVSSSVRFTYVLTPKKSGKITIPAPEVKFGGKTVRGQSVVVNVKKAEAQDTVACELSVDPPRVYVTQEVKVRLKIWIKELPAPYETKHPLAVQEEPPHIKMPFADDEGLPEGVEPKEPVRNWLQRILIRRGAGFTINEYTTRGGFSFFGSRAVFSSAEKQVRRRDLNGEQAAYMEYTFERPLIATRPGNYEMSRATISGMFGTSTQGGQLVGEKIFAVAQPVTLTVADAPEQGRPASFVGLYGPFRATASITPVSAKVGDPMTLMVVLHGNDHLELASAPDLKNNSQLADHFRILDGTSRTVGSAREFTYSIRPTDDSVAEIPPIELSYFDPDKEQYATVATDALSVEIVQGSSISGADIVSAGGNGRSAEILELEGGIAANMPESLFRIESPRPWLWVGSMGSLLMGYAVVLLVVRRVDHVRSDELGRRRRGAEGRAKRRLSEETQASQVVAGLVADATGREEAGITSRDVEQQLKDWELEESVIQRVDELMQQADLARFSGTAGVGDPQKAGETINLLIQALKERKLLR